MIKTTLLVLTVLMVEVLWVDLSSPPLLGRFPFFIAVLLSEGLTLPPGWGTLNGPCRTLLLAEGGGDGRIFVGLRPEGNKGLGSFLLETQGDAGKTN